MDRLGEGLGEGNGCLDLNIRIWASSVGKRRWVHGLMVWGFGREMLD